MHFPDFGLLTDENIQTTVIVFLRSQNFDIKDVKEEGLQGTSDEKLLALAYAEERLILTHDSDFGRLVFTQPLDFTGIIYLRPRHFDPDFTITSLNAITQSDFEFNPPFILVAENKETSVRLRYRQL